MIGIPEIMLSTPYEIPWIDPKIRIMEMRRLYETRVLVEAYEECGGFSRSVSYIRGYIKEKPEMASGVWGYGGDSIAIKISENYYPSGNVREVKDD